ncbi:dehydratase (plasmid) [Rhodococcus sp. USK10]|uniref:MaoC/PaaZ C-terminal domain-containing protein n=1 Tax=Rhodococcus sp. USK10 TaxID=2789739 RepID=UPI001C6018BA|nr:MaoC/PaaZ C-terminal domain-containing protein [Rhodococcus sp. USK10]QYB00276.1 dehydratase [Rhodococcus sp. USK10]
MTDTAAVQELPDLKVGQITRTTLALFAGASGDHNPMHIDVDAARAAGLDDVFGHGMLTMAHLGRMVTAWVPQERVREISGRFTAITPVLASPTVSGRVVEVFTEDGEQRARVELTVRLEDGTETMRGSAVVSWP